MLGQDMLHSGSLCGHQGSCGLLLSRHLRSRRVAGGPCRRNYVPTAEDGDGGSSPPGLISKPALSRPPSRQPAPSLEPGRGNGMQDRPGRQGSGRGYRRQDSFAEPSEGNGEPCNRATGYHDSTAPSKLLFIFCCIQTRNYLI